jgi:hypothetical protein
VKPDSFPVFYKQTLQYVFNTSELMAERTHNKHRLAGILKNDDRPSQLLSFSFLFEQSMTDEPNAESLEKNDVIPLHSNEITFFQSQKSVWFRQLLK